MTSRNGKLLSLSNFAVIAPPIFCDKYNFPFKEYVYKFEMNLSVKGHQCTQANHRRQNCTYKCDNKQSWRSADADTRSKKS